MVTILIVEESEVVAEVVYEELKKQFPIAAPLLVEGVYQVIIWYSSGNDKKLTSCGTESGLKYTITKCSGSEDMLIRFGVENKIVPTQQEAIKFCNNYEKSLNED